MFGKSPLSEANFVTVCEQKVEKSNFNRTVLRQGYSGPSEAELISGVKGVLGGYDKTDRNRRGRIIDME